MQGNRFFFLPTKVNGNADLRSKCQWEEGRGERKKVKTHLPIRHICILGHEGHRGCRNTKMGVLIKDADYNMDVASLYTFNLKYTMLKDLV